MKVGVVGLGSIGRRHVRCLAELGVRDILALRSGRGQQATTMPPQLAALGARQVDALGDFIAWRPDAVIIANPTSLHVDPALAVLETGCRVFIEKPVAESRRNANRLIPFARQIVVGHCLRFSGVYGRMKQLLQAGRLGRLARASFRRSSYLPSWHPQMDYRQEYAARRDLGGGVVRTLSHEIDMMGVLFGRAVSVVGVLDRVSELAIDVDDMATFSCRTDSGVRVSFDLDYLGPTPVNRCEVIGSGGRLESCWERKTLIFTGHDGRSEVLGGAELFDLDGMYRQQMQDFLSFVERGASMNSSLDDALAVLDVIEALGEVTAPLP